MRKFLTAALLCAATQFALAEAPATTASDAALDARVMRIAGELRCLVCQNESIADSTADLAHDLRREVREMFVAGKNEDDVRAFMAQRYGDFVLYDPPVKRSTLLLWIGPGVLLALTVAGLFWQLRRRRRQQETHTEDLPPPDDAALARARSLLDTKDEA